MTAHPIRRAVAALAAAMLIATLAVTALAAEVEAAKPKPKCQGQVATIVGTKKADVIRGTNKRDVIVALGGADRIYAKGGNDLVCAGPGDDVVFGGPGADTLWGQLGHDTLSGNVGPDFLAGQVGNDTINGGIGVDTCYQGTGTGPVVRCERPAPPPAPPPPAPTPPKVLAIAYSDLNDNDVFDGDDVLIARLDDTSGDGVPNAGDTVVMDRYPITLTPTTAADFEAWRVRSHIVTGLLALDQHRLEVATAQGRNRWGDWWPESSQYYAEEVYYLGEVLDDQGSGIQDGFGPDYDPEGFKDNIDLDMDSPSQPLRDLRATTLSGADDTLIDVEIYVP